jgi:hypothetical protein
MRSYNLWRSDWRGWEVEKKNQFSNFKHIFLSQSVSLFLIHLMLVRINGRYYMRFNMNIF